MKTEQEQVKPSESKQDYTPPRLQEHGSVQEVTLQTFFGTFSPPAGVGS